MLRQHTTKNNHFRSTNFPLEWNLVSGFKVMALSTVVENWNLRCWPNLIGQTCSLNRPRSASNESRFRTPNKTSRRTANRGASRQATRTPDACLLAAHVECAICGSGVAIPRCARRPNATDLTFRATPRRNARYELRCLDCATKPDGLWKRTLDRHAAYLDVCEHGLPAL